jgi:dihydrofolate synthase / folylpolyglutamate synthase
VTAPSRSLQDWLALQETVHSTGIDLTLERVRAVAQRLQLLPPACRVITVAGTNGKGSTVAYLTALLRGAGHRVGSFTSPHLVRYNERIRVDGEEATDAELVAAFEAIDAARGDITLTFFEYNLLAALHLFRARGVDHAVLEVGLGGRLDAVNIVDAHAAIVCSIGFDHRDWLGDTLEQIGREKAGVFRAGQVAVLADPRMVDVVEQEGERIGARVLKAQRDYQFTVRGGRWDLSVPGARFVDLPRPSLQGDVQFANAAAAVAALVSLDPPVRLDAGTIGRAVAGVQVPGRFQVLPGPVPCILDVAHNEPAARVLAHTLDAQRTGGRTLMVTGILGDKDIGAIARVLAPVVDQWILCSIDAPRGLSAPALVRRSPHFAAARLAADIPAGIELARSLARPGDRIVVCGSFLAVSPALKSLGLY